MAQQHMQGKKRDDQQDTSSERPQGTEKTEGLDADVDDILDEIDDVLETNAEEFVKGFIQKGGE